MRRSVAVGFCLLVMVSVCCAYSWAQKIEVDPNTPDAAAEQKVDDSSVDERLAQKVTYATTGKRLHTVLEELSAMTGVTIGCGNGKDDWQVRDLPVVVCCKDFPLGKLMKAIAESTHMLLSSYSVDGARSYRVWQDKTRQKQLEDFRKTAREAGLANASLEWDSWVQLATIPESELENKMQGSDDEYASDLAQARYFAKVIAALGPEAKKRVLAGESVCVAAQDADPNLADIITKLYRERWELDRKSEREWYAENPDDLPEGHEKEMNRELSDEDVRQACLEIRLTQGTTPSLYSILEGPSTASSPVASNPGDYSESIADLPESLEFPSSDYTKSLRWITSDTSDEPDESIQFTLDKPSKKEPGFSDVVEAVAKASGYAVVCEDFISHKRSYSSNAGIFDQKTTMDVVLSQLGWLSSDTQRWYVDEQSKLVLGYSEAWYERHSGLVPEAFLSSLRGKLNGDGLELDDVLPILHLTARQRADWLSWDTDMGDAGKMDMVDMVPGRSLWVFYDSLSEEDKARARSESGLPLAKFDPSVVSDVLSRASELGGEDPDTGPIMSRCCGGDEAGMYDIPTEPEVVSKLVLYVRGGSMADLISASMKGFLENDAEVEAYMEAEDTSLEEIKAQMEEVVAMYADSAKMASGVGKKSNMYHMELVGEGIHETLAPLPCSFPLFSEEREKQLQEQAKKPAKESAPEESK